MGAEYRTTRGTRWARPARTGLATFVALANAQLRRKAFEAHELVSRTDEQVIAWVNPRSPSQIHVQERIALSAAGRPWEASG